MVSLVHPQSPLGVSVCVCVWVWLCVWLCVHVCVCVCVCERERERERLCVWERLCVCVWNVGQERSLSGWWIISPVLLFPVQCHCFGFRLNLGPVNLGQFILFSHFLENKKTNPLLSIVISDLWWFLHFLGTLPFVDWVPFYGHCLKSSSQLVWVSVDCTWHWGMMSASVDTLTQQNRKPGLPPFRFGDSILLDVQNLIKKIEQTLSEHKQPMKNSSVFNFEAWAQRSGLSTSTVAILRAKELVTREILTGLTPNDILLLGLPLGQKRLLELAVALSKGVPVKLVPRLSIKPSLYDGRSRSFIYFHSFFLSTLPLFFFFALVCCEFVF